jgi:DNA-binding transcriptional ArsR family regulator
MSAVPANVVDFKLPKRKPKVIEKEAPPDQRTYAVVPLRALRDKRLTSGDIRVLGIMASYANRAGLTWVGQKRMGQDLEVSQQAISKHVRRLTDMGYIEVLSEGFRGQKACTRRIIFDPNLTAQDAIAVTSGIEDTRPPEQVKREEELRNIMADNDLPDLSPEQIQANVKRLKVLLGTLASPTNFRQHQPQILGTLMAQTKQTRKTTPKTSQPAVVRTTKETQNAQPKVVQKRLNREVHTQPQGCESSGLHTQPFDTPIAQPQSCANIKNIGIDRLYRVYELNKKNVVIKDSDMKWGSLAVEVGVTESEMVAAIQSTNSLAEACKLVLEAKGL